MTLNEFNALNKETTYVFKWWYFDDKRRIIDIYPDCRSQEDAIVKWHDDHHFRGCDGRAWMDAPDYGMNGKKLSELPKREITFLKKRLCTDYYC